MVSLGDYAARLEEHPLVNRAHAAYEWGGAWPLVRVAVALSGGRREESAGIELLADIKKVKPHLEDLKIEKTVEFSPNTEPATLLLPVSDKRRRSLATIVAVLLALVMGSAALAFWTITKRANQTKPAPPAFKLYADMSESERLAFIEVQEQRVSALMGDRQSKLNADALQAIKQKVDEYVTRDRTQASKEEPLPIIFERALPYLPTIGRSFRERNVPVIIGVYLAMVESEYLACYESETGAKGLFQFMPGTAALYGVERDEMCNAEKMTPAAAHYLADRMAELGDDSKSLTLVLLSYTTGAEWVRVTLRSLRASGNYDRTFWTMFDKRATLDDRFQQDSVYYVPKFFAVAIIGENPAVFGLTIQPLSNLAR
jgi:soluble lytic murein transglycosylase-like protein